MEIRALVSGHMQSPTSVNVSGLHNLEKTTLVKGELGIMKRSLGFGIKGTLVLISANV